MEEMEAKVLTPRHSLKKLCKKTGFSYSRINVCLLSLSSKSEQNNFKKHILEYKWIQNDVFCPFTYSNNVGIYITWLIYSIF